MGWDVFVLCYSATATATERYYSRLAVLVVVSNYREKVRNKRGEQDYLV